MSITMTDCPVDLAEGLARAGDDREFYKELLEIFLEDAPERIAELKGAGSNAEVLVSAAHSIKGAAANLSATDARDAAWTVERRAREGDLANIESDVERLEREIGRLDAFYRSFEP